ncbi:nucleolar protein dao-5-like isoform X1 [Amphibalanus amphitrite]|nr:nucleolar protein dao-5-like isoform X1 [Amphibalanus amphitrite]XP_043216422.1 nucleolar protein dao-5-like isoform X1 [Amphibalanus amphitrite]
MMSAPPAAPPAPTPQALHRTQFIRGVRDSMAKALAQGLGDSPAEAAAPPAPQPPPSPRQQQVRPKPALVKNSPTRISLTGRLKQLIGVGPASDGVSGDPPASEPLVRTPPRTVPSPAAEVLVRTPPRAAPSPAASVGSESPLRSPVRVLNLSDHRPRSPVRVLSAADQQRLRPAPPPATSLKPIVRLPEGSAAEQAGVEPAANGEASEERKRMIALAQLKILQRKTPGAQKLAAQESLSAVSVAGGSPIKTYGRRAELVAAAAAAAANGAAESPPPAPPPQPRKNVKLMPPLTLLVPPVKSPVVSPAELLKPDVEDASRCASGLLIRKTYYKATPVQQQPPPTAVGRNGSLQSPPPPQPPQQAAAPVERRGRGRPRRAAVAAAAVVSEAAAAALQQAPAAAPAPPAATMLPPPSPVPSTVPAGGVKLVAVGSSPAMGRSRRQTGSAGSPITITVLSSASAPAASTAAAAVTAPTAPSNAQSAPAAAAVPASPSVPAPPTLSPASSIAADSQPAGRKRRHGSSGRGSDTSSVRSSSADTSPRPKKSRPPSRDLKALFVDEGAINILSEMKTLNGEKRRTRVPSSDKLVYTAKAAKEARDATTSPSATKRSVVPVCGSLRALPAARARSPLKKDGRTVNKIRAKAIKMKKQADAKKAAKMTTSAKLKALKAKIKEECESPSPSPKPTPKPAAKAAEKPAGPSGSPKAPSQKAATKTLIASKATKLNKGSSAVTALVTKKPKATAAAAAGQLKPKPKKQQPSPVEKPDDASTSGKKSPASASVPSAAGPAPKAAPVPQEKAPKPPQPRLTQDKNLNIIEKRTAKEPRSVERKKSGSAEERQPVSRSVSRDKSSSPSSKSSSKSSSPLPVRATLNTVPTSPSSLSYSSLQRRLEVATLKQVRRKEAPGDRERSSSRSNLGTIRHREICVKKFDRFHQVILCPVTTRLKAGLNVQVMREIREYLSACERDPTCRAVLLTSSAGPFCQGLDYTCLLGLSPEKRRKAAEDLAKELKDFVRAVAGFSKPLMAGVTGSCVGLGVSLLPLCDLVYVTEKATLQMPYARLGTVPEGGATHSLTALLGHAKSGAMVMTGRAMTGTEAVSANLATGLVWAGSAYEELVALARQMLDNAAQLQALESTKALLRHSLRAKLEQALHSECRLLVHQWSAPEFQQRVRQLYDEGGLLLQKAGFDTQ